MRKIFVLCFLFLCACGCYADNIVLISDVYTNDRSEIIVWSGKHQVRISQDLAKKLEKGKLYELFLNSGGTIVDVREYKPN